MEFPDRKTVVVHHCGRKSGRTYKVTVWYVVMDGDLWLGTLDDARNWVRNLKAADSCKVDFGDGPLECSCENIADSGEIQRFRRTLQSKYPIGSRLIRLLARGRKAAFRLRPLPVASPN